MTSLYPNIECLFAGIADLAHDKTVGHEMALGWGNKWIDRYVAKEHREDVAAKARKFLDAIR
jgi:hypothetical protein